MNSTLYLRIASVLTMIHAVMHTIGGVFGKPSPGVAATVVATMRANRFAVFGVTRSYEDFYFGLGLGITIFLSVAAILLWQLGTLARTDAARLRPILLVLMAGFFLFAVDSYFYFFLGPVVAELLIALCLGLAIPKAKPVSDAATTVQLAESGNGM